MQHAAQGDVFINRIVCHVTSDSRWVVRVPGVEISVEKIPIEWWPSFHPPPHVIADRLLAALQSLMTVQATRVRSGARELSAIGHRERGNEKPQRGGQMIGS